MARVPPLPVPHGTGNVFVLVGGERIVTFTVDVPFRRGAPEPMRGIVKKVAAEKGIGSREPGGGWAEPCHAGGAAPVHGYPRHPALIWQT